MRRLVLLVLLVPALALAIYDMKWFDLNHWTAPFHNEGRWGYDPTVGSGVAAGSWPRPLHNCYVFGAGTWLGAVVGSSPPETLCTFFYNPNSGGTEAYPTLCRYWRQGHGDSLDRVYKYPGDWPPPHSRFPMAPLWSLSDMDLWCGYCDSAPENHIPPGRPIGIDIYSTVYGFSDSLAQDFFFLRYEIANCLGDSIRQACFGPVLDPDIGSAADDIADVILDQVFYVGSDTIRVRDLAFAYDYDNIEYPGANWDSGAPGTVAIALLAAPDSLGLTAFKRFTIDFDPVSDPAQYLTLAGYDYRTGQYRPYDSNDIVPADKRFVMASGPFDLAPDSSVTFWYVVIGSPFGEWAQLPPLRDTSELALRYKWALEFWRLLFPGVAEGAPLPDIRAMNAATIVRGVLFLPSSLLSPPSSLFYLDGRKVLDLRPGANDVGRLSPGVYFVRRASGVMRDASSVVTKVVITR